MTHRIRRYLMALDVIHGFAATTISQAMANGDAR